MIDKKFFEKHQKSILWAINTKIGRWLFGVEKMGHRAKGKRIVEIGPNYILTIRRRTKKGVYLRTQKFCRPEYGIKLGKVFFWNAVSEFPQGFVMRPAYQIAIFIVLNIISVKALKLPFLFGTVSDYNPNATGNGILSYYSASTWATAHDATDATHMYASGVSIGCTAENSTNITLRRGIFNYDGSNMPDNATISNVIHKVYVTGKADNDNDGEDYMATIVATPASPTTLALVDFDQFGTTEFSGQKDISAISLNAYLEMTFNATGKAAVSKTGYTNLGIREGHDILNHAASLANYQSNSISCNMADAGSNKPVLSVDYFVETYTLAVSAGSFSLTGISAIFRITRKISAVVGSFSLTGVSTALTIARKLSASVSTFNMTGVSALLLVARKISATVTSFTLSGVSVVFTKSCYLVATTAHYVLLSGSAFLFRSWSRRTKPTTTFTRRTKPTTTFTKRTKPTTNWTK